MRISDDRYARDRLRFDIAMRFIRHEARTHTIRQWTGLTDDRIRKLYRSYLNEAGGAARVHRHRGKSPHQTAHFMRTVRMRHESAVLASVCRMLDVLPATATAEDPRLSPGIRRAHLLCQAYEVYCDVVPAPLISFEHAVFLVATLMRADELALEGCRQCGALVIVDRLSLRQPRCVACHGPH